MYENLKGQVALVTGAGKRTGIGFAVAEKLAKNGVEIVLTDLGGDREPESETGPASTAQMEELAAWLEEIYGVKARALQMDVCDTASIERARDAVAQKFGRLDILVNNAGASFGVPSPVHNYEEGAWLKTLDVNLNGVFRVSKAFVPLLAQNQGRIVNVASRAGKVPALFNGAYAAAKAAVIMLTKVMAKEVAGMGIRVNAICPGQIMTDLQRWRFGLEAQVYGTTPEARQAAMCETIPMGRIGDPEEAASLVAYLVSPESSYLTGQAVNVCGGQLMEL